MRTAGYKIILSGALTLLLQTKGFSQTIDNQTIDNLLSPSDVKLKGILGKALDLSEQGRLKTLPGWHDGTLITMFSPEARSRNTTTDWYGEHAGKWMYATALAAVRTGDDSLKALLMRTADYLIRNQEADGYMGSYSPALRITNETSKLHKKSCLSTTSFCVLIYTL